MEIRTAQPDDAETVATIYISSRRHHVACAPLAHTEDEVRDWVREVLIPRSRVLVIEDNDAVVAMMALAVRDGAGWIDQLYVAPDLTGRGYGTTLLEHAKQALPRPVFLFTFQANAGARRFYERHGFHPERFSDGLANEERTPDVLYRFDAIASNHRTSGPP